MGSEVCLVNISITDSFKIHVLSFFCGFWVLCKRLLKRAWNPNSLFHLQLRDRPPDCLVDTSLGQHKYVKLKGVKFHYVEAGPKDRPLVLLLHGFPDCWLSWRYQIPALSEHFRVVALDLKGFGDSDKPLSRRNYRIDIILEELKQLVGALRVAKCVVIGHDLGGLLGWYLMKRHPETVEKFVSVSCSYPNIYWKMVPSQGAVNYQWLNFVQLPYLPEIDALKEDLKIISDCHKHLKQRKLEDEFLEAYKYSFSRREDWTGPMNYYRNLPFVRINEKLDQISISTLLMTGDNDKIVKLEDIIRSTEYCEKVNVKVVENSGHFPHQENPDRFNAIVLKFLEVRPRMFKSGKSQQKGIMDRMFGTVSSTVKYGTSVFDNVHKKTNGVVNSIPTIGMYLTNSTLAKTED